MRKQVKTCRHRQTLVMLLFFFTSSFTSSSRLLVCYSSSSSSMSSVVVVLVLVLNRLDTVYEVSHAYRIPRKSIETERSARFLWTSEGFWGHLHFTGTELKSSYLMMGVTSGHSDGHVTLV